MYQHLQVTIEAAKTAHRAAISLQILPIQATAEQATLALGLVTQVTTKAAAAVSPKILTVMQAMLNTKPV